MKHIHTLLIPVLFLGISLPASADIFDKLERAHSCAKTGDCGNSKKLAIAVKTKKCMEEGTCDQAINTAIENNQDKIRSGLEKVVAANNKKAAWDACLSTTDPAEQARCKEMSKSDYESFKQAYRDRQAKKAEKERKEAEPYRWDGKSLGGDVRICTRGKDKPMVTVLAVTPSKVKVQVTKSGGNAFLYYSVGEIHWLEKNQIGC